MSFDIVRDAVVVTVDIETVKEAILIVIANREDIDKSDCGGPGGVEEFNRIVIAVGDKSNRIHAIQIRRKFSDIGDWSYSLPHDAASAVIDRELHPSKGKLRDTVNERLKGGYVEVECVEQSLCRRKDMRHTFAVISIVAGSNRQALPMNIRGVSLVRQNRSPHRTRRNPGRWVVAISALRNRKESWV